MTHTAPSTATLPTATDDDFGFVAPEYDPAEYRWVPVRRRPRHDGWTEEKQRRFIEVLADTGLVGLAAREVGMTRARELAGALIEDIAFERAIEGVEVESYDGHGELAGTRTVHNDRLVARPPGKVTLRRARRRTFARNV